MSILDIGAVTDRTERAMVAPKLVASRERPAFSMNSTAEVGNNMTGEIAFDGEIRRIQDVLDKIGDSGLAESAHAHVRLWFRGHSKRGWQLQPAVYRSGFPHEEAQRLRMEQHLTQDFRVQSAGLLIGRETDADLYFLQQHYRMPTRLLDWTQSPLAALYFAVATEPGFDGELFMMDGYQLSPSQQAKKDFEGIPTSRHPLFRRALKVIFEWETADLFPGYIIPVRPDHFDRRISLQRGCFTFHVPNRSVLTKDCNNSLRHFLIPANAKNSIRKELFLLGMDDFNVYGDLESLARTLRRAHNAPSANSALGG